MGNRKINNMGMYYLMVYNLFIKHNNNIQQFHATYNNTGYQIDIKMHRDLCWCNHQVFIYTGWDQSLPLFGSTLFYCATVYDTDLLIFICTNTAFDKNIYLLLFEFTKSTLLNKITHLRLSKQRYCYSSLCLLLPKKCQSRAFYLFLLQNKREHEQWILG